MPNFKNVLKNECRILKIIYNQNYIQAKKVGW